MTDDFKFEIGGMYENMKGMYEVISIDKNKMVIRWDGGDEAVTSVDLQRRIIARMIYEKELLQRASANSKQKNKKK